MRGEVCNCGVSKKTQDKKSTELLNEQSMSDE
jgi:hypothetical protein